LMIARGGVTTNARRFANRVMHQENLSIMFITGEDIEKIDEEPNYLRKVLRSESRRIHNRKKLGERDMVDPDEDDKDPDEVDETEVLKEYGDELEDALIDAEDEQIQLTDLPDE